MDFHRGPHTQAALEAVEVVIGDVLLDHLDQLLPAGEPPAIVALPLEDAPEALHRAVIDAMRHAGHALRHSRLHELVVKCPAGILESSVTVKQWLRTRISK